jgi:hypothetical protein
MIKVIYILCGLTSLGCAILLVRRYQRTRGKLLLLGSVFFMTQVVTNILLFVDLVVIPDVDLSILRSLVTIVGLIFLLVGLIWETT